MCFVYREDRLSGFAFIMYPIEPVSHPIVRLSYPIVYHVKGNGAGTVSCLASAIVLHKSKNKAFFVKVSVHCDDMIQKWNWVIYFVYQLCIVNKCNIYMYA